MRPPAAPPRRIAANAAARAAGVGSADRGRSGSVTLGSVFSAAVRSTVVVPTYEEAQNIEALCRGIRTALPEASILIIDDGGSDGTADIAEALAAELGRIEVVRRAEKSGLGSAYRDGFRRALDAGAEVCVQMDADLSHPAEALPALVANVEHGADLAIGSRYVPGGRTLNWPRRRVWLSRWGNRYAAGVLGLAVNDATAGFRAYRADVLRRIDFESVGADGYGFQVEMTYRLVSARARIVEFPITFVDRAAGNSKISGGIVREALVLVARLWIGDFLGRRRRRRAGY